MVVCLHGPTVQVGGGEMIYVHHFVITSWLERRESDAAFNEVSDQEPPQPQEPEKDSKKEND